MNGFLPLYPPGRLQNLCTPYFRQRSNVLVVFGANFLNQVCFTLSHHYHNSACLLQTSLTHSSTWQKTWIGRSGCCHRVVERGKPLAQLPSQSSRQKLLNLFAQECPLSFVQLRFSAGDGTSSFVAPGNVCSLFQTGNVHLVVVVPARDARTRYDGIKYLPSEK